MSTRPERRWREIEIADDRALAAAKDDVRVVFGIGPPSPVEPPESRMKRILASLKPELSAIRWGEQIHGQLVASIACEPGCRLEQAACVGRCDALITAEVGVALAVWTADCVPILMAGGGVVAAVHSGWRGAADDVAGATVHRFEIEYGVPPDQIQATLGPAISGPRYPVGDEVIDALKTLGADEGAWRNGEHVDLRGFLHSRLEGLGLHPSAIADIDLCTVSSPDFASYRRDGKSASRQFSLIYRTAKR
jgi:YfiH family protein